MASIFTYEPEIFNVSSPWTRQVESQQSRGAPHADAVTPFERPTPKGIASKSPRSVAPAVTRLEPEPQEGPVEYKLHLMLRPRRNYVELRSIGDITGTKLAKYGGPPSRSTSESVLGSTPVHPASSPSSHQVRQHRLEQLTTQLLWRLQQSSPHHTSSASNFILPCLPEALPELQTPPRPAKLLHGLEESKGALYEIGVSDDGTFVGLAEDEMLESLNNLRAMAASLGCVVEVVRMVDVGNSEWLEDGFMSGEPRPVRRMSKLVVAEALVKPHLVSSTGSATNFTQTSDVSTSIADPGTGRKSTKAPLPTLATGNQLRVTLTGATMSGKSSLLGTLSTSTLDNGRGKSRLSMLKHRHEITSGITSSVTQELIGYRTSDNGMDVCNYATSNVSSWIDIHAASSHGRLVFFSDSAGHPRYRRTTVRGLVGWAPHWTLICVPADNADELAKKSEVNDISADASGPLAADVDLSAAHLDLCLRLGLPLVVVITKLDIASKTGLRSTLSKLLSTLKLAGRRPVILPNAPGAASEEDLQFVPLQALKEAQKALLDPASCVPIIMTSAIQGIGIQTLHALLHELPMPNMLRPKIPEVQSSTPPIFFIEDVYNRIGNSDMLIVSGHLHIGQISVGDELLLGPCFSSTEESDDSDGQRPRRSSTLQISRSFPGALRTGSLLQRKTRNEGLEWRRIQVSSIRNLRLPVSALHEDQVGTIGLKLARQDDTQALASLRVRKGMTLSAAPAVASSSVVARFRREDLGSLAVGNQVVLYIASVRASARIVSARIPEEEVDAGLLQESCDDMALLDASLRQEAGNEVVAGRITHHFLLVTFHFDASKEYVEVGAKVLVMPGGGPGLYGGTERGKKGVAGLEGFVGVVMEVCE